MENDMLSSLLSDPAALQSAVQAVSGLLGGTAADGGDPAAAQSSRYTASGLPGGVSERAQGAAAGSYDPAAEMMQRALPVLGAIMQSGQGAVRQEKRALLGALKPLSRPRSRASSTMRCGWSAWRAWRARPWDSSAGWGRQTVLPL